VSRGVVLCADDYALTPGISKAIINLVQLGRLSALSCMTGAAHWREHATWLASVVGKADIGLHLTLVEEAPITPMPRTAAGGKLPSIEELILKSHARVLDRAEIKREITAQFEAFEATLGRVPDHIDGHLHTHVLPGIRDIVLEVAAARAPKAWLRNVAEPMARILKRGIAVPKTMLIAGLGYVFARRANGTLINDGFSGVYGLAGHEDIAALFDAFLNTDATRPVILCHPGDCETETVACQHARINEYRFFLFFFFADMLARKNMALRRFNEL